MPPSGIAADPAEWRRVSWFYRLHSALEQIVAAVPAGQTFILVDDNQWASGEWVSGRRRLLFPNRDGVYWGRPADDGEALEELARLRSLGARYLAIGWPAFWYREYFRKWDMFIRHSFRCVAETDVAVVFDLTAAPAPQITEPSR